MILRWFGRRFSLKLTLEQLLWDGEEWVPVDQHCECGKPLLWDDVTLGEDCTLCPECAAGLREEYEAEQAAKAG